MCTHKVIHPTNPTPPPPTARLRAQGPAALASIPLLNPATWAADRASGKLGPNTLVRFRGMVQDMLDPQFFVGVQRHARTGALRCALYSDGPAGVGIGGGEAAGAGAWEAYQTMERRPLILTPIPGEAPWVMEGLRVEGTQPAPKQQQGGAAGASGGGNKRGLGDGGEGAMEVVGEEEQQQQQRGGKAPRIAAADDAAADAMAVDGGCSVAVSAASVLAAGGGGLRCLSYFYGEDEEEAGAAQQQQQPLQSQAAPRLNEAVDVLAVLCYTPAGVPAMGPPEGEQVDEEEAAMEQLLLGLEPRLHILLWAPAPALVPTPAAFHDPAPFLLPTPTTNADNVTANDPPVPAVRAALLAHLTAALDGDALAAEYLLLALISRVRLRTPTGDVVGPLPLNLSRATPETAARVASLVGRLCPRSRVLTVDLPTLDDPKAFIPRKDPARLNVLETTPLQVCPGTALVLDETRLDSGRLGAEGAWRAGVGLGWFWSDFVGGIAWVCVGGGVAALSFDPRTHLLTQPPQHTPNKQQTPNRRGQPPLPQRPHRATGPPLPLRLLRPRLPRGLPRRRYLQVPLHPHEWRREPPLPGAAQPPERPPAPHYHH